MNLDWILSPLTVYAVVGLSLVVCVFLFLSAKWEVCRVRQAANQSTSDLSKKMAEIQAAIADGPPAAPAASVNPRVSLNLTKRAQALRMRRRGESLESITAALAIPRNEVELLIKVHGLLSSTEPRP
ncbi:MAG: hypothetical protein C5B51_00715 [Terriglobia bacterium]|nr:MAG: hypothetical protein C5B51_00715 [Terriglobia bacterium]